MTILRRLFSTPATIVLSFFVLSAVSADNGSTFPIPELQSVITIDADGSCSDADWPAGADEVLSFTLQNTASPAAVSGSGKFVIEHPDNPIDEQALYLWLEINDNSSEAVPPNQDTAVLMFDLANGHALGGGAAYLLNPVRGIRFLRGGETGADAERVFNSIASPSLDAGVIADARVCIDDTPTGWTIEARIEPGDLARSDFKVFTAAAIRVTNLNSPNFAAISDWPTTGATTMLNWHHLLSRPPIDYVMVVDQSGSMGGDKWAAAKAAGNHLREILVQLNDTTVANAFTSAGMVGGGDRVGLAAFSSSLGGNADVVRALGAIAASPADYTGALPASPGGGTPIAAGVNEAVTMFGGAASVGNSAHPTLDVVRQKVVMLLSDGMHNVPSTTMNFDVPGVNFSYLPVSPDCDVGIHDSFVHVHPVAVGSDSTVDTGKLDQIKDCYSGERFTGIYNISGATEPELTAQLTQFYFTTLLPYYQLNALIDPSTFVPGMNFDVRAGERNLLVFAFWPDVGSRTNINVTDPSSGALAGVCPAGVGYCVLAQPNPVAGTYTNLTATGAVAVYALLDLQLEARFAFDNEPHGTSSTISLRARLQENGMPLTGATVKVDIAKPEQGFGTFASTQMLDGCKRGEPGLPSFDFIKNPDVVGVAAGNSIDLIFSSPNLAVSSPPVAGDTKPPAFALMDALLKACGQDALKRGDDNGLILHDDGSNGDEVAGDGIYTYVYQQTEKEGSYVARFRAEGNDSNGKPFTRVQQISEYVRLDVDPASSQTGNRILQTNGNLIVQEFYVIPRDKRGEYLGPGHADEVRFQITNAQAIGGVRDHNNGMYAQVISYDKTAAPPVVVPIVQDQAIPVQCPDDDNSRYWLKLLLLLVLVLLILLVLCWRRKR